MTKICMLTATSILFDSRIQKEALSLSEKGYKVVILSIEDQSTLRSLEDEEAMVTALYRNLPGVDFRRKVLRSRVWKRLPDLLNRALQSIEFSVKMLGGVIAARAQIYHCHDLTPALFAWVGKWLFGAKIVYDAHELELAHMHGVGRRIMSWIERGMIRRSDLTLTVNNAIRDIMETEYSAPVHVVQNRPYYFSSDQLDRSKLRKMLPLVPDDRIVMYVGYLTMERGIDKLVIALKYLEPNIHIVIMGTGRIGEFRQELTKIMTEHEITTDRVHFVGPVPPTEVIQYLCGADVSTMLYQRTSDNMLFNAPNKLFQSIIAQVPILASRNATFPPIVEPSANGRIGLTVDESNPKDIASALHELLTDDMQELCRKNLGEAAINVSWEAEKIHFLELYEEMANARD